ncbi:ADP-ribosylglycohydrolase family protein [Actinomadura kijaniata]|uniref:ADP-ribosylglycohydrolase family protein n=1 Tax=Actinomadura kijaniata TaxID=46161 RepID=UPI00082F200D|nr:ADP-ribosylglycohydrolase family protein [Actinomadura kijaniata]
MVEFARPWGAVGEAVFRSRVRGCLLGGALGDALGYPVEFHGLAQLRAVHGPGGVAGPVLANGGRSALISDDTQMTLFTAEGLIRAHARFVDHGADDTVDLVRNAHLRWLDTQTHEQPPAVEDDPVRTGWLRHQRFLYALRAPGNACLTGLRSGVDPGTATPLGEKGPVNPDSKGCGGVMRSAPFGLVHTPERAFELAARSTLSTHGHPTGSLASGAFAAIVAHLMAGESLLGAVLQALELLRAHPSHEETSRALRGAIDLAAEGRPSAERVEGLGGGWVAEEALAIAVHCALAEPDDVARALSLAVTHGGDSDSTGAICGNLLGARHGDAALPADWLAVLEGRGTITALADDLAVQYSPRHPRTRYWRDRYPAS